MRPFQGRNVGVGQGPRAALRLPWAFLCDAFSVNQLHNKNVYSNDGVVRGRLNGRPSDNQSGKNQKLDMSRTPANALPVLGSMAVAPHGVIKCL
jgi:hypothetical protein